jgi:probable phosphoglycerate mutase
VPDTESSFQWNGNYVIVFDGGAIGNPGKGYGSFHITGPRDLVIHERREYGDRITNNVAEYRTLIAALERLQAEIGDKVATSSVHVLGDSQLVIKQTQGAWKVKKAWLQPLRDEVVRLLGVFGAHSIRWQPRRESVRVLGH